jgi:PAS domain S-box-containing protein
LEVNDELCRILGYEREELLRMTWPDMTHPDDLAADVALFERVVSGELDGYVLDKRWIRKDGRVIDSIVSAKCVRRADGSVDYFVGLVQDITDRKQASEALAEARLELTRMMRVATMGELAASIAHEVNQPLAAIAANAAACARWLAAAPPDLQEVNGAIERVIRDANRAADVIRSIRTFLQRGPAQPATIYLNEAITGVVAMVQNVMRMHAVSLHVVGTESLPPVFGDRVQVQQVILNLVMNAIEAMTAVTDRPRTLEIEAARDDDGIRVAVRDCGVGLAREERQRIFEAFHTTKPDGLGMGLAISRSIIEAHRGRLWSTPNADHGETFQFTLPLAPAGPSAQTFPF